MIGFADEKMLPKLYAIWQECFEDEKDYIDIFFQCFAVKDTVMVYMDESGEPVSMLSVLPAYFEYSGQVRKAAYLYGVATAVPYRNLGYSSRLLNYAVEQITLQGAVPFLSPAGEALISFYEKSGFAVVSRKRTKRISRYDVGKTVHPALMDAEIADVSLEEYAALRNRAYGGKNFLRWPLQTLNYAQKENAYFGGKMQKIRVEGKEYGVLYRVSGQKMDILEITEPDEGRQEQIARLLLHSKKYIQTAELTGSMCAMAVMQKEEENLYMNLTMG